MEGSHHLSPSLFGTSNLILHYNDSTLLNSNESASALAQSINTTIKILEEILHNRIYRRKEKCTSTIIELIMTTYEQR
jgi:hypothetical protein